jgi:hypothetical protein
MSASSPDRFVVEALELGQPGLDVESAAVDIDLPRPACRGFAVDENTALANDPADEGRGGRRQVDHVDAQTFSGLFGARCDPPEGDRTARVRRQHHRDVEVVELLATRSGAEEVCPADGRLTGERPAKVLLALRDRVDLGSRSHAAQGYQPSREPSIARGRSPDRAGDLIAAPSPDMVIGTPSL